MATIITLQSSDQISSSRADINTSLANLNSDKIETSYLDTDTAMAANSDTKIPSQKAVKTYIDTQGGANASETVRGIVEEATDAEVTAGTSTGATGAKLVVTPAKLATRLASITSPVVRVYGSTVGSSTSQFDITNPVGTTFRYTWDGTGTDPGISASTFPTGYKVNIRNTDFADVNNGTFTVTGSGTDYFEVTNASGSTATNQVINNGHIQVWNPTWTKPATLKYVTVRGVGAGGGGGGCTGDGDVSGGGGAGGYGEKLVAAASLGSTETVGIGLGGVAGVGTGGAGGNGTSTTFGSHLTLGGGTGGGATNGTGGAGGTASGGDINVPGARGGSMDGNTTTGSIGGAGASSPFGGGGPGGGQTSSDNATHALAFGAGGGGGESQGSDVAGAGGMGGVLIVTEFYV